MNCFKDGLIIVYNHNALHVICIGAKWQLFLTEFYLDQQIIVNLSAKFVQINPNLSPTSNETGVGKFFSCNTWSSEIMD